MLHQGRGDGGQQPADDRRTRAGVDGAGPRRGQELLTSEQVAASVNTNPVIIRRSLGDLRRAGLVDVRHGAGAGWSLARAPEEITLLDVYEAVEQEPLFGMHRTEPNLECPVGRGIRPALGDIYGGIEQTLRHELAAYVDRGRTAGRRPRLRVRSAR